MTQTNPPEAGSRGAFAKRRIAVLGVLGAAALIGVLLVAIAFQGGSSNGDTPASGETAAGESGGLASDATPAEEGELDLGARPTEVAVQSLTSVNPGDRFVVSKIGVDAPLTYRKVGPDGQMPNPDGPDDIAYYDFSEWPGLGGAPGGGGNAVFAGHVDSGSKACKNGTVPPPCQAVLWDLNTLKVGDEIEVRVSGQSYKYQVTANQPVPAATGPWDQIVSATAQETLTVITCSGNFNRETRSYSDRQVLTAVRI